ncbi:hypothetical protein CYMTET_21052 [Cymbomonas tetramitiformis]|uniref:Phosphatidic acid phosphatase type 2/haloperoxidase domain-containing protein n=1 Tax=Cymbomonas tetramitiformis TaxID=36881 RepID=A0AAE0G3K4_9CHLO|nr:hypothetical protein CYMTET_21052 [Cymbomonas tetramitiformis]
MRLLAPTCKARVQGSGQKKSCGGPPHPCLNPERLARISNVVTSTEMRTSIWIPLTAGARWLFQTGYLWEWLTALLTGLFAAGVTVLVEPTQRFIPEQKIESVIVRDAALLYPVKPDLVSGEALVVVVLSPIIMFAAVQYSKRSIAYHARLMDFHHACLSLCQALAITFLITNCIKNTAGRHRPSWYDRVELDYKVRDGKLSYPSGHASMSFASMGVATLYLMGHTRVFRATCHQLLLLLLSLLPIGISTMIAVSRTLDYHHYYSDINAGCFIGMVRVFCAHTILVSS